MLQFSNADAARPIGYSDAWQCSVHMVDPQQRATSSGTCQHHRPLVLRIPMHPAIQIPHKFHHMRRHVYWPLFDALSAKQRTGPLQQTCPQKTISIKRRYMGAHSKRTLTRQACCSTTGHIQYTTGSIQSQRSRTADVGETQPSRRVHDSSTRWVSLSRLPRMFQAPTQIF